jgi:YidC/Oxa1 family membrane protein insertase
MLLTVLTKILLFPLAYKSVKSMNRIKAIQPKINKLKEQYDGNTILFQQALVSLYKKEKVNPASGCLPIILQMPVFFALYKVLYVTIEMRHAPFFLWLTDLSAPDSTTVFNLFGLIPWDPPLFLMIGILPILMSLTMFIQQQLNPQPTDQTQAIVMKIMPLMLLFMFAQFPSGLLIYWTWSNIISIMQQVLIRFLPD